MWEMVLISGDTYELQELITRSLLLPHILVTAVLQTDVFLACIKITTRTSVTNCKQGLMLTCRHYVDRLLYRHVHVRPHCFILTF